MNILPNILLLLGLILLLVKAADLLEDSFVGISRKLRINTFTTGFVILALTSSLPETFVAIDAAINNQVELSIGNLVGATIILMTLVIGINAVKHKSMPFRGFYGTKEVLFSLAIIYTQVIALIDKRLQLYEGIFLVLIYGLYILYVVRKSNGEDIHAHRKPHNMVTIIFKAILGIIGLIIISNLTVNQAITLATALNIPPIILGLLVFSFGTNLPELIILFRSNGIEKTKLAAGNFIGSAVFNTAVLGLLTVIRPSVITNFQFMVPAIIALAFVTFIFSVMVINDKEISRKEGISLIIVYALYMCIEIIANF